MEFTRGRRRALSTVLALVLAVESVSAVAAAAQVGGSRPDTASQRTSAATSRSSGDAVAGPAARTKGPVVVNRVAAAIPDAGQTPARVAIRPAQRQAATRATILRKVASSPAPAKAASRSEPSTASGSPGAATFSGRNRLWIPALGLNRSIAWFPCSRAREPDNLVYRWGCAGSNNVYLLGHAWGVFRPLHDAYTSGRLKVGMRATYADASGRVRTYAVRWWKVVRPTTNASWAWASLGSPSMTLQTCVGAKSQYRLMVRLTQVGG